MEDERTIPDWIAVGRTILLPKSEDLSDRTNYRPITCLITMYKLFTGLMAKNMKQHAMKNELWDENQMGTREGTLGTVDHLLVDRAVLREIVEKRRSADIVYYDYRKAYDLVPHQWMEIVLHWMGFNCQTRKTFRKLQSLWRTRLEIVDDGKKIMGRIQRFKRGFFQGDSLSPVVFCLCEVPLGIMMSKTNGYRFGNRKEDGEVRVTHSYYIDDLRTIQESKGKQELINETVTRMSKDIGMEFGVKKCAELKFTKGKMEHSNGLEMFEERIRTLNPGEEEFYTFLGIPEGEGQLDKEAKKKAIEEVTKRVEDLCNLELYERNLIKSINSRALSVLAYGMNVVEYTKEELQSVDRKIRGILTRKGMIWRQSSNERLYMPITEGGRGLKSARDVYYLTKARVACYMSFSRDEKIAQVFNIERNREGKSMLRAVENEYIRLGKEVKFERSKVMIENQEITKCEEAKRKLKRLLTEATQEHRQTKYKLKKLHPVNWNLQSKESWSWLRKNLDPKLVGLVIALQEQIVPTRWYKNIQGLSSKDTCRLCGKYTETVDHILGGCAVLASIEYTKRHDQTLMVLMVEIMKKFELIDGKAVWYRIWAKPKEVVENSKAKIWWNYEWQTPHHCTNRRPDMVVMEKAEKKIWIIDMACPLEKNIEAKEQEKRQKYQQLAEEIRTMYPEHGVRVVPVVVGCLGGVGSLCKHIGEVLKCEEKEARRTVMEMQRATIIGTAAVWRRATKQQ